MIPRLACSLVTTLVLLVVVVPSPGFAAEPRRGQRLASEQRTQVTRSLQKARELAKQSDFASSEMELRAALTLIERGAGEDFFLTRDVRHLLAVTLSARGKLAEAEKELRDVLRMDERQLGAEHPTTLETRKSLALALANPKEAEAEFRALLRIQERNASVPPAETISNRRGLALALSSQNKTKEAEAEFRTVLRLLERSGRYESREALDTRHAIAQELVNQRNYPDAELLFEAAGRTMTRLFGENDPGTLRLCANWAYCLGRLGRMSEARYWAERAAEGGRKVFGPDHPETKRFEELYSNITRPQSPTKSVPQVLPSNK